MVLGFILNNKVSGGVYGEKLCVDPPWGNTPKHLQKKLEKLTFLFHKGVANVLGAQGTRGVFVSQEAYLKSS